MKEILADGGVEALRRHETAVLFDALATDEPGVIAAAAGVVLDGADRVRLRESDASVVWLTADPSLLALRAATRAHRPWLDDHPFAILHRMQREREPCYDEVADRAIAVAGLTPDEIADRIIG